MPTLNARAQIADREWVEFAVDLDEKGIVKEVRWAAWGCHHLLDASENFSKKVKGSQLETFAWPGGHHWDLLLSEVVLKLKNNFKLPVDDPETCHCRKIPTTKVDEAIVLGAHTAEKVRAWTTASSGCGTCRPDVQKLIDYRLSSSRVKASG